MRSRRPGKRGDSERRGLAGGVVTEGLIGKVVKPPGLKVALELAVPGRPVVFQKPGAKLRKLLWRQRLDLLLDSFDFAHDHEPLVAA